MNVSLVIDGEQHNAAHAQVWGLNPGDLGLNVAADRVWCCPINDTGVEKASETQGLLPLPLGFKYCT